MREFIITILRSSLPLHNKTPLYSHNNKLGLKLEDCPAPKQDHVLASILFDDDLRRRQPSRFSALSFVLLLLRLLVDELIYPS